MVGKVGCAVREATGKKERERIDEKSCDDGGESDGGNRVLCYVVAKPCKRVSNWVSGIGVWRLGRSDDLN
jgi:hypothetical protein